MTIVVTLFTDKIKGYHVNSFSTAKVLPMLNLLLRAVNPVVNESLNPRVSIFKSDLDPALDHESTMVQYLVDNILAHLQ